ncbi:FAD-binding oxidoreductase [Saccharothrix lopnurensis]|uniref:FAD-binding oxidoreductase n=1 Tax=Saccharothrix lopnurensis TaxID=1670621 RepID=A0ABW1P5L4_9PSEU
MPYAKLVDPSGEGVTRWVLSGRVPEAQAGADEEVEVVGPRWALLRERLAGDLLLPGDDGYDTARLPFNSLYDHRVPAAVARCASPDDVRHCLAEARRSGLPVAARGGGHGYAADCVPHGGLVVDLAPLSGVEVRPDGTAVVGAGARLRDVYAALIAAGRFLPLGNCHSVGIAGLTLGGGIGWADRAFGLTCDRLRSARVVTTDSREVTASGAEHEDLFWALRGGGGGNFGVVTSFEFATAPVPPAFTVFRARFPAGSAADVLGAWQPWSTAAPEAVSTVCVVRPDGTVELEGSAVAPAAATRAEVARLLAAVGTPAPLEDAEVDHATAVALTAVPQPERNAFRASSRLSDGPWTDPAAIAGTLRDREAALLVVSALGGAIDRPADTDTAYPHRGATTSVQVFADVGDLPPDRVTREVDEVQRALVPLVGRATYVNYLDPLQEDWAESAYRHNLPRLRRIAHRYDPDGVLGFPRSVRA